MARIRKEIAKQYLSEGKLQGSDLAWHAGADGWKPPGEIYPKVELLRHDDHRPHQKFAGEGGLYLVPALADSCLLIGSTVKAQ